MSEFSGNLCENSEEDHKKLLKNYSLLQQELETAKQTLHENRRQLRRQEALEFEYKEEIAILQNQETEIKNKYNVKIKNLSDNLVLLKSEHRETVAGLTKKLVDKDEEIEGLKNELEAKNNVEAKISEVTIPSELLEEFTELREKNSELLKKLTESSEDHERKTQLLEKTIAELKRENEELQETATLKKDELVELKNMVEFLQDELLCANQELSSLKSKPLDVQSRGNSLFAEVDDKRVELVETMKKMKTQYIAMKKEQGKLLKQIAFLNCQNTQLLERWEKEQEEKNDDLEAILESHKYHEQILKDEIVMLKTKLNEARGRPNEQDMAFKFYENMIESREKEIEELNQKLQLSSLNETIVRRYLAEAHKRNHQNLHKISQLENEIQTLLTRIEELELNKLIKETEEEKENEQKLANLQEKERRLTIWANLTTIDEETKDSNSSTVKNDDLEEAAAVKKVHFSEDIPEKQSKKPTRRGGTIIISKPVHFSSKKK